MFISGKFQEKSSSSFLNNLNKFLVFLLFLLVFSGLVIYGAFKFQGFVKDKIRESLARKIVVTQKEVSSKNLTSSQQRSNESKKPKESKNQENTQKNDEVVKSKDQSKTHKSSTSSTKNFELPEPPTSTEDLLSSSFTDLFSGTAWINEKYTSMYHDRKMTAFTFPPEFEWQEIDKSEVEENRFLDSKPEKDIPVPSSLNEENIVSKSEDSIGNRTLVGVVLKKGDRFKGKVYYFEDDGFIRLKEKHSGIFSDVSKPFFESKYKGKIDIGGSPKNFLVVYGAYEGKGKQVKPNHFARDISFALGARVMNEKGFNPEIIQAKVDDKTLWYIYSLTEGLPKLLKLVEKPSGKISAGIDLSDKVFDENVKRAEVYFDQSSNSLKTRVLRRGKDKFFRFEDQGVKSLQNGRIVSSDINTYPADVVGASLKVPGVNNTKGINFFLASKNGKWVEVQPGEDIGFENGSKKLFWKAEVEEGKFENLPPFLDQIRLRYKVKF